MQITPLFASSFEGIGLGLQFPVSFLAAMVALWFAFDGKTRLRSVIAAFIAVLITIGGLALEMRNYSFDFFKHHWVGATIFLFPLVVSIAILLFGCTDSTPKK